jgi:hypothetical protein
LWCEALMEQRVPWWHGIGEVEGRHRKRASITQPPTQVTRAPAAT